MPVDVRVSAATAPAPEPAGRALQIQGLRFDESRGAFRWEHLQGAGPYTFVVLGADYREVARFDGIGAAEWQPSGTVASALQAGATYHAFVRSVADRGTVRSALLRLTWR